MSLPTTKPSPQKGDYQPANPTDLRAPCPVLNSLANHGLISRSGRNITSTELTTALRDLGLGIDVASLLVRTAFKVHTDDPDNAPPGSSWSGLRDPDQVNSDGTPVLNLDQVGRPHAIEHDVSLTRQDRALGDYMSLNPDLYAQLLSYPEDTSEFRVSDLGRLRKMRYEQQKQANGQLQFEKKEHYIACVEAAAVQMVFGQGVTRKVPRGYIEALFGDERLPYQEGWRPRSWKVFLPEVVVFMVAVSGYAWPF
ncbi:Cloroperoxidase [Aspergillus steynii IBT 23096]|uniref:Cloroperoxidase n=1 Tax=Aspergillus steynii IBT 23096 TaxID=1392250 RepID=A0A2I2GGR7_9EURO|nr:Cloroperoxidase [Aspergillus steynii IBT 23096]PLB52076.1 Cloroperoxidase [Aspergillus steynii IBT 23096]